MREIKFKGIHPMTKTIMDVCVIDWMHDEVYFEQGTDISYKINECNLMQYTGLKDANGVEIYDVDIVDHNLLGLCLVKFEGAGFNLRSVESDRHCGIGSEFIKVIGNIHENPELLK